MDQLHSWINSLFLATALIVNFLYRRNDKGTKKFDEVENKINEIEKNYLDRFDEVNKNINDFKDRFNDKLGEIHEKVNKTNDNTIVLIERIANLPCRKDNCSINP